MMEIDMDEENLLLPFDQPGIMPHSMSISQLTFPAFSASRITERTLIAEGLGSDRENSRNFHINNPSRNYGFCDNRVNTTKYTMLTFLPLNLLHQFSKTANFYFLMFALLQTVPQISDTHGQPTIGIPLSLVVMASVIKDWIEDWKRASNDYLQNSQRVLRADPISNEFTEDTW